MPSSPGTDHHDTASGAPVEEAEAPARHAPSQADQEAEIARLEDRYKRALADLDNYRKRSAREVERRVEEARDALLREWLEAVDTVERAARMDRRTARSGRGCARCSTRSRACSPATGCSGSGRPGNRSTPSATTP